MDNRLAQAVECLLFVSGEPITLRDLARATESDVEAVEKAIALLRERYTESGVQIVDIAGGVQMATRPEFATFVGRLLAPHANRLSRPALETVAIVAYQQPCTQAEIEAVRGVASDGVLRTLSERGLVREAGRKPTPGRPILYETTDDFLHYFGLSTLSDLPPLDDEDVEEAQQQATTALAAAGVSLESENVS